MRTLLTQPDPLKVRELSLSNALKNSSCSSLAEFYTPTPMVQELTQLRGANKNIRETYRDLCKILRRSKAENASLTQEAELLLSLIDFDADSSNGGVAQYFTNSNGRNFDRLMFAVQKFQLDELKSLLDPWIAIIPAHINLSDADLVGIFLFSNSSILLRMEELDSEFYRLRPIFLEKIINAALRD